MLSRKSVFLLLATVVSVSSILLFYAGVKPSQPPGDLISQSQGKLPPNAAPKRYGKITVPADVSIGLAESSHPGKPVTILISASSQIPVGSAKLTLKVPPVGEFPAGTEVVWSGEPSDFVDETAEYAVDVLPEGKYHFAAILEFTPDREDAGKLFTSKALYLDVRPEKILSSNVSFDQIKRVELWEELEQRVLADLKAGPSVMSLKSVSRDIQAAKPLDRDIIASRIASLKASDPEVARRITELNRVKTVPVDEPESVEKREQSRQEVKRRRVQSRPAPERAVPIPERYRDR